MEPQLLGSGDASYADIVAGRAVSPARVNSPARFVSASSTLSSSLDKGATFPSSSINQNQIKENNLKFRSPESSKVLTDHSAKLSSSTNSTTSKRMSRLESFQSHNKPPSIVILREETLNKIKVNEPSVCRQNSLSREHSLSVQKGNPLSQEHSAHARTDKKQDILNVATHLLNVQIRSRSKSPIWIPGETPSYSDVLRGNSRCNSRAASTDDLTAIGENPQLESKSENETKIKSQTKIFSGKGKESTKSKLNITDNLLSLGNSQEGERSTGNLKIFSNEESELNIKIENEEFQDYSAIIDKTYSFLEDIPVSKVNTPVAPQELKMPSTAMMKTTGKDENSNKSNRKKKKKTPTNLEKTNNLMVSESNYNVVNTASGISNLPFGSDLMNVKDVSLDNSKFIPIMGLGEGTNFSADVNSDIPIFLNSVPSELDSQSKSQKQAHRKRKNKKDKDNNIPSVKESPEILPTSYASVNEFQPSNLMKKLVDDISFNKDSENFQNTTFVIDNLKQSQENLRITEVCDESTQLFAESNETVLNPGLLDGKNKVKKRRNKKSKDLLKVFNNEETQDIASINEFSDSRLVNDSFYITIQDKNDIIGTTVSGEDLLGTDFNNSPQMQLENAEKECEEPHHDDILEEKSLTETSIDKQVNKKRRKRNKHKRDVSVGVITVDDNITGFNYDVLNEIDSSSSISIDLNSLMIKDKEVERKELTDIPKSTINYGFPECSGSFETSSMTLTSQKKMNKKRKKQNDNRVQVEEINSQIIPASPETSSSFIDSLSNIAIKVLDSVNNEDNGIEEITSCAGETNILKTIGLEKTIDSNITSENLFSPEAAVGEEELTDRPIKMSGTQCSVPKCDNIALCDIKGQTNRDGKVNIGEENPGEDCQGHIKKDTNRKIKKNKKIICSLESSSDSCLLDEQSISLFNISDKERKNHKKLTHFNVEENDMSASPKNTSWPPQIEPHFKTEVKVPKSLEDNEWFTDLTTVDKISEGSLHEGNPKEKLLNNKDSSSGIIHVDEPNADSSPLQIQRGSQESMESKLLPKKLMKKQNTDIISDDTDSFEISDDVNSHKINNNRCHDDSISNINEPNFSVSHEKLDITVKECDINKFYKQKKKLPKNKGNSNTALLSTERQLPENSLLLKLPLDDKQESVLKNKAHDCCMAAVGADSISITSPDDDHVGEIMRLINNVPCSLNEKVTHSTMTSDACKEAFLENVINWPSSITKEIKQISSIESSKGMLMPEGAENQYTNNFSLESDKISVIPLDHSLSLRNSDGAICSTLHIMNSSSADLTSKISCEGNQLNPEVRNQSDSSHLEGSSERSQNANLEIFDLNTFLDNERIISFDSNDLSQAQIKDHENRSLLHYSGNVCIEPKQKVCLDVNDEVKLDILNESNYTRNVEPLTNVNPCIVRHLEEDNQENNSKPFEINLNELVSENKSGENQESFSLVYKESNDNWQLINYSQSSEEKEIKKLLTNNSFCTQKKGNEKKVISESQEKVNKQGLVDNSGSIQNNENEDLKDLKLFESLPGNKLCTNKITEQNLNVLGVIHDAEPSTYIFSSDSIISEKLILEEKKQNKSDVENIGFESVNKPLDNSDILYNAPLNRESESRSLLKENYPNKMEQESNNATEDKTQSVLFDTSELERNQSPDSTAHQSQPVQDKTLIDNITHAIINSSNSFNPNTCNELMNELIITGNENDLTSKKKLRKSEKYKSHKDDNEVPKTDTLLHEKYEEINTHMFSEVRNFDDLFVPEHSDLLYFNLHTEKKSMGSQGRNLPETSVSFSDLSKNIDFTYTENNLNFSDESSQKEFGEPDEKYELGEKSVKSDTSNPACVISQVLSETLDPTSPSSQEFLLELSDTEYIAEENIASASGVLNEIVKGMASSESNEPNERAATDRLCFSEDSFRIKTQNPSNDFDATSEFSTFSEAEKFQQKSTSNAEAQITTQFKNSDAFSSEDNDSSRSKLCKKVVFSDEPSIYELEELDEDIDLSLIGEVKELLSEPLISKTENCRTRKASKLDELYLFSQKETKDPSINDEIGLNQVNTHEVSNVCITSSPLNAEKAPNMFLDVEEKCSLVSNGCTIKNEVEIDQHKLNLLKQSMLTGDHLKKDNIYHPFAGPTFSLHESAGHLQISGESSSCLDILKRSTVTSEPCDYLSKFSIHSPHELLKKESNENVNISDSISLAGVPNLLHERETYAEIVKRSREPSPAPQRGDHYNNVTQNSTSSTFSDVIKDLEALKSKEPPSDKGNVSTEPLSESVECSKKIKEHPDENQDNINNATVPVNEFNNNSKKTKELLDLESKPNYDAEISSSLPLDELESIIETDKKTEKDFSFVKLVEKDNLKKSPVEKSNISLTMPLSKNFGGNCDKNNETYANVVRRSRDPSPAMEMEVTEENCIANEKQVKHLGFCQPSSKVQTTSMLPQNEQINSEAISDDLTTDTALCCPNTHVKVAPFHSAETDLNPVEESEISQKMPLREIERPISVKDNVTAHIEVTNESSFKNFNSALSNENHYSSVNEVPENIFSKIDNFCKKPSQVVDTHSTQILGYKTDNSESRFHESSLQILETYADVVRRSREPSPIREVSEKKFTGVSMQDQNSNIDELDLPPRGAIDITPENDQEPKNTSVNKAINAKDNMLVDEAVYKESYAGTATVIFDDIENSELHNSIKKSNGDTIVHKIIDLNDEKSSESKILPLSMEHIVFGVNEDPVKTNDANSLVESKLDKEMLIQSQSYAEIVRQSREQSPVPGDISLIAKPCTLGSTNPSPTSSNFLAAAPHQTAHQLQQTLPKVLEMHEEGPEELHRETLTSEVSESISAAVIRKDEDITIPEVVPVLDPKKTSELFIDEESKQKDEEQESDNGEFVKLVEMERREPIDPKDIKIEQSSSNQNILQPLEDSKEEKIEWQEKENILNKTTRTPLLLGDEKSKTLSISRDETTESVETVSSQDGVTIGAFEIQIGIAGSSQAESFDDSTDAVEVVAEIAIDDSSALSQTHEVTSFDTDIASDLIDTSEGGLRSAHFPWTKTEFTQTSFEKVESGSQMSTTIMKSTKRKTLKKETNIEIRSPETVSPILGASSSNTGQSEETFSVPITADESKSESHFIAQAMSTGPGSITSVNIQNTSHTVAQTRTRSVVRQKITKIVNGKEVEVIDYPDLVEESKELSFSGEKFSEIPTIPSVSITEVSEEEANPENILTEFQTSPLDRHSLEHSLSEGEIVESVEHRSNVHEGGTETRVDMTIVQPIIRQVRKIRKVIRKVVIIDGKEHVSESVIEEPEQVIVSGSGEETSLPSSSELAGDFKSFSYGEVTSNRQVVVQSRRKITKTVKTVNGKVLFEEVETEPEGLEIISVDEPSISVIQFEKDGSHETDAEPTVIVEHPEDSTVTSKEPALDVFEEELIPHSETDTSEALIHENIITIPLTEEAISMSQIHEAHAESQETKPEIMTASKELPPEISQSTGKLLNINKKSVSFGSDSSDSYYTDVLVNVTVPDEVSLSVDIKQPKDKKKIKKSKKKSNGDKSEPRAEATSFVKMQPDSHLPNFPNTKSITTQFLEAESSFFEPKLAEMDTTDATFPLQDNTSKGEEANLDEFAKIDPNTLKRNLRDLDTSVEVSQFTSEIEPEVIHEAPLPPVESESTQKEISLEEIQGIPVISKQSIKSIISVQTTLSPSEKGEKAITLKVSKKDKKRHKKHKEGAKENHEASPHAQPQEVVQVGDGKVEKVVKTSGQLDETEVEDINAKKTPSTLVPEDRLNVHEKYSEGTLQKTSEPSHDKLIETPYLLVGQENVDVSQFTPNIQSEMIHDAPQSPADSKSKLEEHISAQIHEAESRDKSKAGSKIEDISSFIEHEREFSMKEQPTDSILTPDYEGQKVNIDFKHIEPMAKKKSERKHSKLKAKLNKNKEDSKSPTPAEELRSEEIPFEKPYCPSNPLAEPGKRQAFEVCLEENPCSEIQLKQEPGEETTSKEDKVKSLTSLPDGEPATDEIIITEIYDSLKSFPETIRISETHDALEEQGPEVTNAKERTIDETENQPDEIRTYDEKIIIDSHTHFLPVSEDTHETLEASETVDVKSIVSENPVQHGGGLISETAMNIEVMEKSIIMSPIKIEETPETIILDEILTAQNKVDLAAEESASTNEAHTLVASGADVSVIVSDENFENSKPESPPEVTVGISVTINEKIVKPTKEKKAKSKHQRRKTLSGSEAVDKCDDGVHHEKETVSKTMNVEAPEHTEDLIPDTHIQSEDLSSKSKYGDEACDIKGGFTSAETVDEITLLDKTASQPHSSESSAVTIQAVEEIAEPSKDKQQRRRSKKKILSDNDLDKCATTSETTEEITTTDKSIIYPASVIEPILQKSDIDTNLDEMSDKTVNLSSSKKEIDDVNKFSLMENMKEELQPSHIALASFEDRPTNLKEPLETVPGELMNTEPELNQMEIIKTFLLKESTVDSSPSTDLSKSPKKKKRAKKQKGKESTDKPQTERISSAEILDKLNIVPEELRKSLENLHSDLDQALPEVVEVGLGSERLEEDLSVIDHTIDKYINVEAQSSKSPISKELQKPSSDKSSEVPYVLEVKTSISSENKSPSVSIVEGSPGFVTTVVNDDGSVQVSITTEEVEFSSKAIHDEFIEAEIRHTEMNIKDKKDKSTFIVEKDSSETSEDQPSLETVKDASSLPSLNVDSINLQLQQKEVSFEPNKETSENLIQTIKERTRNISTPSFVGLLSDLDTTGKRKEINHNLDLLKNSSGEERDSIIITTTILISEYLETITYIIINSKKLGKDKALPEDMLKEISHLVDEVTSVKEDIQILKSNTAEKELVHALETQTEGVKNILDSTKESVNSLALKREEAAINIKNILIQITKLMQEIEQLEKDQTKPAEMKLKRLDELELLNAEYDSEVGIMLRQNPAEEDLAQAAKLIFENEEQLASLRTNLVQSLALAQEYRDTLAELDSVSKVAKQIVASRVVVPSLKDLQNEMQKERKFFVSLSHCRSILESLEGSLDGGTRAVTAELHGRLHAVASEILEAAGERAVALALGASRWTLLEQGLAEERAWLQVAQERVPDLAGLTTDHHNQYLSLYQTLESDIELHSARVWKLLENAHTLQGLISCNGLEESCDILRASVAHLEDRVSEDVRRLLTFKELWSSYEASALRLTSWLDSVIPNHPPPLDIHTYWQLKAEHEVWKTVFLDCCNKFSQATSILTISDEAKQMGKLEDLKEKWFLMSNRLTEAEVSIPEDVSSIERLDLIDTRLKQMEAAVNSCQDMSSEDELDLYIGKLQVLVEGSTEIENELLRFSLGPASERRRLGSLQGRARVLKAQVTNEHAAAVSLKERLNGLRAGMIRASRVHNHALKILNQWEPSIDSSEDVVRQALENVKEVVRVLCAERVELSWVRETLGRLPISLRARLSLTGLEREISSLSEEHAQLGKRAEDLLAEILSRLHLWDVYGERLEAVRGTVREADYMMELLRVDTGPIDLPRIIKASTRLQGVEESLREREGGLEELRGAGRALETVVRPEVGERLRAEVREEEAAWARAEAGLGELAGRYRRAAKLWATYREAADRAQAPIAQQPTPEEWEQRENALREAARLAEEIARETGVAGVLEAETQLLARRLQETKEVVGEQLPQPIPPSTDHLLAILQQKVDLAPEGNEKEQVIALRDTLLELGKTDAQISVASAQAVPTTHLLQLWEKVFRETFQEYHRLSSRLVESEETSSVVNLWRDYLDHVNHFLDSSLPQHYHELHEHHHLCQVHQTVLSSQRSLLPREDAALDKDAIQQFSLLTNMHNETLAKIMEKQSQVENRISAWDRYRQDQASLLDWLKRTENERNQLKLRYIHAKTIGRTISKIEELLKKMPEGEELEMSLKEQLHRLVAFCDESVASSLQVEHASLSHRLSNLHAALLTWKDYLLKVQSNIECYEKQVSQINQSLEEIHSDLEEENKSFPKVHSELEHRLQTVKSASNKVKDLSALVNALEESKDLLKDSLSPADLKFMDQKCWLFTQQQNEFEHQLLMAEQVIRDRLQLTTVYEQRSTRFLSWVSSVLGRLSCLPSDAHSALAMVERDLRGELALKKNELDWLNSTGTEIGREENVATVTAAWTQLQEALNTTADKLNQINKNIPRLEENMDNLRIWLHKTESKLTSSIVVKQATKKCINGLVKEHESVEKEIEMESSKITDVLNLCESLLNDCESCHVTLDTEGITIAMANLEKKWKEICAKSNDRKSTLVNLWQVIEKAQTMAKEQKSWLSVLEKRIQELEKQFRLTSLDNLPNVEADIMKLESDMKSGGSEGLKSLDQTYLVLQREYRLPEEMIEVPASLLAQWEGLAARAEALSSDARARSASRERWLRAAARAVSAMAKVDAILTLAEVQESSRTLEEIENELEKESPTLKEADISGLEVMKWCIKSDVHKTQATIDEYQNLWKDISERLNKLRKASIETQIMKQTVLVEDQSVEVNTLRFERDESTQVDTLGWSPPIARKEAFCQELYRTIQELETLLSKLADLTRLETQAEISKCIGECESSYELAKHLSETLLEQCSATEEEALVAPIFSLGERFEGLRDRALNKQNQLRETSARGRLTCPLCSTKNWQQLDNDLWRLEQWLQFAEGTLSSQPSSPPPSIEQLEEVIQDQRELLLDLDSHRSLVVSMNIVGTHLAEHSEDEGRAKELRNRLAATNTQWERVCELATAWQAKLQTALLQNEEFHDTISELTEWLEKTENTIRQAEPIDLYGPSNIIQAKYNKFKEMGADVERCEARVRGLEEAARQVVQEDRVVERLGRLRLRLTSLSRLVATYSSRLSAALAPCPAGLPPLSLLSQQLLENPPPGDEQPRDGDEVETGTLVRCHRLLGRVMRASVPISAFLLLLLGAASFVPVVEQDFICANSFLYQIAPALRYPNGPPPM